ncbi:hypothetical protein YC2023_015594 [Brassica napus]
MDQVTERVRWTDMKQATDSVTRDRKCNCCSSIWHKGVSVPNIDGSLVFVGYKIIDHARYNRYKARMQLSFKITANRDSKMSSPSAETNNVQNIQ